MVDFQNSRTKDNLMRSFAGESQARNRYKFAATKAKENKLYVIQTIFTFTSDQEKEHAEIFYHLLKQLSGQNLPVNAQYPVDDYDDVVQLLRSAQHNEYQEYQHDYAQFGTIAQQEGFTNIANTYHMIADIEKTHGDRFGCFADLMDQNKLFREDNEIEWICLNCGHVHKGNSVPMMCPVCSHDQGYFIRRAKASFES